MNNSSFPEESEKLPADLEQELAELDAYSDEELWQAAHLRVSPEIEERMLILIDKHEFEGVNISELEETAVITDAASRVMLIRAQSAALLKQRGYDVDKLLKDE